MIGLPRVPEPSSLLWTEGLSRRAVALVDECRQLLAIEHPRTIESIYHDAQSLHEQGDRGGCAVISIHLSDISRAEGRLGPALKLSQRAEQLFCCWPESRYKHNHAVALYSLGLVHQLLGSDNKAWDCYAKALEGFEEAKQQWITLLPSDSAAKEGRGQCESIIPWIEMLMTYVSRSRALGGTSAIRCSVLVGCWPLDKTDPAGDPLFIDATVKEITVDMHIHLENNSFELAEVTGTGRGTPTIQPGKEYRVLQVPKALPDHLTKFKDAEYVLVCKDVLEGHFGIGIEAKTTDEILWGKFSRSASGDIQLEVAYPDEASTSKPRIIGKDELDQDNTGSIVGAFKAA